MPIISTIFVFLLNFDFVLAEFSYQPLSPLPDTTVSGKVTDLGTYITGIYKIAIGVAIILAVLSFIIAGLEWMTAEAVGKKEDAIKKINAALFGLLLTLGSWLFLNTINPATVNFNLKLDEVSVIDSSAPIIGGWYCQLETGGPYYGPYQTEESCVAKAGCTPISVPGTNNRYCQKAGRTPGGVTGIGITDTVEIQKFFDTGITKNGTFIKYEKGPGLYFQFETNKMMSSGPTLDTVEQKGPYKTAEECNNARQSAMGNDPLKRTYACYLVEWGSSDYVLNKMLVDEKTNEIRSKLSSIKINNAACTYIGETNCTNVGGLYFTIIDSINTLKKSCDSWITKEKLGTSCDIVLTAGTEWWLHGGNEKEINKNNTEHRPTFWDTQMGRDVDMSSDGTIKTTFTQYIIKHTDKICSGGNDITKEKTMDPGKKKENLAYLADIGLGKEFNPGDFVKFCVNSPYAMFRFELKSSPHWHVRFGACEC